MIRETQSVRFLYEPSVKNDLQVFIFFQFLYSTTLDSKMNPVIAPALQQEGEYSITVAIHHLINMHKENSISYG